jgi:hypothetical protein
VLVSLITQHNVVNNKNKILLIIYDYYYYDDDDDDYDGDVVTYSFAKIILDMIYRLIPWILE